MGIGISGLVWPSSFFLLSVRRLHQKLHQSSKCDIDMYECAAWFSGWWEVCEERLLGRHRGQSFCSPGHRERGEVVLQEKQQRSHEGEVGAACYTSPFLVHHLSPVLMVSGTPTHWFWTCRLCLLHQSTLCTSSLSSSNGFWYTDSLVLDFADCACYTSPLYVPHLSPVLTVFGTPTHLLHSHRIAIVGWLCLFHQSILSTSSLSSSNGFWYANSLVTSALIPYIQQCLVVWKLW